MKTHNKKRRKIIKNIQIWIFRIFCLILIFFLSFHICSAIRKIYELVFMDDALNQSMDRTIFEENNADPDLPKSSNTSDSNAVSWYLILVNSENPLPPNHSIELTQLKNNQSIDSRCYPDLQEMMDDCRKEGLEPLICSSYRSSQKQEMLFQEEMNKYISAGYSEGYAFNKASESVAIPGTSEHQLGLAVDIVDTTNQKLDFSQEKTKVQKWLMNNSWKYGFVLRYPNGKSDLTGIIYEPWHYRYVGREAAKIMYEKDFCLEEYLAYISSDS